MILDIMLRVLLWIGIIYIACPLIWAAFNINLIIDYTKGKKEREEEIIKDEVSFILGWASGILTMAIVLILSTLV